MNNIKEDQRHLRSSPSVSLPFSCHLSLSFQGSTSIGTCFSKI